MEDKKFARVHTLRVSEREWVRNLLAAGLDRDEILALIKISRKEVSLE